MNEYLARLSRELPDVRRIFLCEKRGTHLGYNIERHGGELVFRDSFNENRSTLGHFNKTLETLTLGGKSCLSFSDKDFAAQKPIMTYFYDIGDDWLLIFDLCVNVKGN